MNRSEAGRLGAIKTMQLLRSRYEAAPAFCQYCKQKLPFKKKHNKFCNTSCSASFNNSKRCPTRLCLRCSKQIFGKHAWKRKFCSHACQFDFAHDEYIQKWKVGEIDATTQDGVSEHVRKYLLKEFGHRCAICHFTEWQGRPIPLLLDHVDGNAQDSSPSNVRMICGNCNMQLPTFCGRNIGKGRPERRARYKPVSETNANSVVIPNEKNLQNIVVAS